MKYLLLIALVLVSIFIGGQIISIFSKYLMRKSVVKRMKNERKRKWEEYFRKEEK